MPSPAKKRKALPARPPSLRIITINLHSHCSVERWTDWCYWLSNNPADAYLITECKVDTKLIDIFKYILPGWLLIIHWSFGNNGVGIVIPIRSRIQVVGEKSIFSDNHDSLIAVRTIITPNTPCYLACVYGCRDQTTITSQICTLNSFIHQDCIIGGDFNWDPARDKNNLLINHLQANLLVRVIPKDVRHTFARGSHQAHLDHFWVSPFLNNVSVHNISWEPDTPLSDHTPVALDVENLTPDIPTNIYSLSRSRKCHRLQFKDWFSLNPPTNPSNWDQWKMKICEGIKNINARIPKMKGAAPRRAAMETAWRRHLEFHAKIRSPLFFRRLVKPIGKLSLPYPTDDPETIAQALGNFSRPSKVPPKNQYTKSMRPPPDFPDRLSFQKFIKFKWSKAGGPNNLPPGILGISPTQAIDALYDTLKAYWESSTLPSDFCDWRTFLIPKTTEATDIGGWRPIALTNTEYRILTRIILRHLRDFIEPLLQS